MPSNLVPGDTNGVYDVFLRDLQTGATERASLAATGDQADGDSSTPSLSADGRFVAFQSYAANLVSGDTNGNYDVFVRDRQTGAVERSSLGVGGIEGNAGAYEPSLSADGQIVAFKSGSGNLIPGDTNGSADIFVRDRPTGSLERATLATDGTQGDGDSGRPASSATGRYVAFESASQQPGPRRHQRRVRCLPARSGGRGAAQPHAHRFPHRGADRYTRRHGDRHSLPGEFRRCAARAAVLHFHPLPGLPGHRRRL